MAASKDEQKLNVGGQRKNSFATDLAGPLKQIVGAVQGSLLDPHPCGLDFEDSWLQLETTDENFHRYSRGNAHETSVLLSNWIWPSLVYS